MTSPRALLAQAEAELVQAGVPNARVDAELLLSHVTARPRAMLRMGGDVSQVEVESFQGLVRRRAGREPLQHLTGSAPFRYLELEVGPGVFVPRPETELIVDVALDLLSTTGGAATETQRTQRPNARVADLCTGSGALALALATERPATEVVAVELDPRAAEWTARNLAAHADRLAEVGSTVRLVVADATTVTDRGEALEPLAGTFDAVLTNPPYIPDTAVPRDPEVRDHDPALALYGGADGLDVVRLLARQAHRLLRPGGLLAVEHADVQGEAAGPAGVPGVLREDGWSDVTDHLDLAGLPRFTTARRGPDEPGSPT